MKNAIHMLHSITNTQMNSFLITTASGKIIAIDGGLRGDALYFLEYLRSLTGQEIPHIDVWFLTHPHLDHIDAFMEIMEHHRDALTVGEIRFGFPSVEFMALEDQSAVGTLGEFYRVLPLFADRGADAVQTASLIAFGGRVYVKLLFFVLVSATALCGVITLALQGCDAFLWRKSKTWLSLVCGAVLALAFTVALQPYATVFSFVLLSVKALLLIKRP